MANKRHHKKSAYQATRDEIDPELRLRENISDLFLSGEIAAKRARNLFADASAARASNVEDLGAVAEGGNTHRDLLRKLQKKSKMPPLYEAPIPMWNPKKNQREIQPLAFMLPHELLWAMAKWNSSEVSSHKLFDWANGLREDLRSKLEHETAKLDLPEDKVVAMGIWVDGVPTKFDRSESLECFSLSFPHLETSAENKHIRLPLTLLNKSFFLKSGETIHAIFKILCWSFHACLQNYFPTVDEHGHEHTSNWRRKKAGEELGAFGLLLEIRGDWLCYKQTFGLPNWAEKSCRCCWRCHCTTQHMREVGTEATWRLQPSTWEELCMFVLERRGKDYISPVFSLPAIDATSFVIDWLHTADLGVAADFAGNVIFLLAHRHFGGSSFEEGLAAVWMDLRKWYNTTKAENQFGSITPTMVRAKATKSPKLKGKAGEIRYLVPWLKDVTQRLFARASHSSEEATVREAAVQLDICYQCLSPALFDAAALKTACRRFLLLYVALEQAVGEEEHRWRYKPKFHLFQHCCESTLSPPSLYWTYTDETWGGKIAQMGRRRGGKKAALSLSSNVLTKFRAQNKVPEL